MTVPDGVDETKIYDNRHVANRMYPNVRCTNPIVDVDDDVDGNDENVPSFNARISGYTHEKTPVHEAVIKAKYNGRWYIDTKVDGCCGGCIATL